jgi:chromosome transmission fidelity protein 1
MDKVNKQNVKIHKKEARMEIVEKPRSIILAGGTMEPISSIIQQLFPNQISRVEKFQFGHVIPDENILPICLSTAPSSNPFEFTFLMRSRPSTMNDLGTLIINLCNVVPGGIVVFFPSYAYESTVYDYWLKNSIIRRIEAKKKFFREPKKATEVESVLLEYKETIDKSVLKKENHFGFKGALLSCVIGGKMSEGINFSDQYGRLVVVVGLPYPNLNDLELKEKMSYLNSIQKESGTDYYDDLCMKAVNQSIGRSIRHIKDYASILLLDKRYCRTKIQSRLPNWIRSRLQTYEEFGPAFAHISHFFRAKSQNP